MKVIWEAKDICVGRRVCRNALTEEWIIGYDPRLPSQARLCKISMKDGMVAVSGLNEQQMADDLNKCGEKPIELLVQS